MKRNLVIAVAAVLLIAIAIVGNAGKNEPPTEVAPKVGYLAPNFTFQTLQGTTYTFDHANMQRPAVINFWASWCGPCQSEAPALAELHQKYKGQIEFLAVNLTSWEFLGEDEVTKFVEEYNLQMPILLDEEGETVRSYQIIGAPLTVLVDTNGAITYIFPGEFNPAELDRQLAKLL